MNGQGDGALLDGSGMDRDAFFHDGDWLIAGVRLFGPATTEQEEEADKSSHDQRWHSERFEWYVFHKNLIFNYFLNFFNRFLVVLHMIDGEIEHFAQRQFAQQRVGEEQCIQLILR